MRRPTWRAWLVATFLLAGCDPDAGDAGETEASARDEGSGDESTGAETDGETRDGGRAADGDPEDPSIRRIPCGADGTFSFEASEVCFCFSGFTWCDPDDTRSLTCCAAGSESDVRCGSNAELSDDGCACLDGYTWCSEEVESLSCCPSMGG